MTKRAARPRSLQREPLRAAVVDQPVETAGGDERVTSNRVLRQAVVIFAVALIVRAIHFWSMRDSVFFSVLVCDAQQYDRWAQRLTAGDWLGSEIFYQTPFYPYLLGVIYTIFGHSLWAVRMVQAVLGSLACVFAARAGAQFFNHRVGWAGGLLLAGYPPAIFFDGILQKASLDLFLMTGLLWAIAATQIKPTIGRVALAGLLLGGMTLNRENAVLLIPLLAIWILWFSWSDSAVEKSKYMFAFVIGLAVVLLPVGWRNHYVGGQFLLTTSQMGPNFYIGNRAGASGLYESLRPGRGDPLFESQDARLLAEQAEGRELSPGEISTHWMNKTWQDIAQSPGAWVQLIAWKWLLTWNRVELVDADSDRVHAQQSPLLGGLSWLFHFGLLCPLAAVGIWLTRRDWRRLWVLYLLLVVFAAAVTLFFVFARYRYPLVPVVALFAAAGLIAMYDRYQSRSPAGGRELAIAGTLAGMTAVFCNWPLPNLVHDHVSYITTATSLMDDLRNQEALDLLKEAIPIAPGSAEIYNNMGCAASNLKRFDEAQTYFQRAIELDANCVQAYYGLGEICAYRRDLPAAIRHWRRAIEIDPLFADPYRSLGHTALIQGDIDGAIGLLQQSLSLQDRSVRTRVELATALITQGNPSLAAAQLHAAVELIPRISEANNLAWILATAPDDSLRNADHAVRLAELACQANDFQDPELLDTLAAAHANGGRFDEAVEWIDKAIALASEANNAKLVQVFAERRQAYLQRQPFRDPDLRAKSTPTPSPKKDRSVE